ncbi:MAG: type II secretion system protein GspG, partial [Thermoanaerobaculales bacterium]
MTFLYSCPSCGHRMDIPDDHAGRELFCTTCKESFIAPEAGPAQPLPAGDAGTPCPACGRLNPTDATYCNSCGGSLAAFLSDSNPMKRPGLVTLLAMLNILGGVIALLAGIAVLATGANEDPIVIGLGIAYLAIGCLQIATGVGLWNLRSWGRTLQTVLAVIGLIAFPFGTIISALVLYYLYRPGVKVLFSGKQAQDLTPDERAALVQLSSSGSELAIVIIGILVAVGLCGMVAAIAIPNLLNAINRGRQKRSVADIRTLATAIEAYRVDYGLYPAGLSSIGDLDELVTPTYLRAIPDNDGWRQPFVVWSSHDGAAFGIASLGRDGVEGDRPGGATTDFDADIMLE